MALGQFFLGQPSRIEQVNRFNPQQLGALQQILSMGLSGIQDPYQGFDPIEKRARSQFSQQTIPSLAERFTSLGSNSLSSPAFASQLGQSAAGLEEGLAALRSQYGLQNRSQLMDLLNIGLTPQQDNFGMGAQPGLLGSLLPSLGSLGTQLGAGYLSQGRPGIMSVLQNLAGIGF